MFLFTSKLDSFLGEEGGGLLKTSYLKNPKIRLPKAPATGINMQVKIYRICLNFTVRIYFYLKISKI